MANPVEQAAHGATAAHSATYGGSGLAVGSSWLIENNAALSSVGILVGIAVGVIGLGFSVYFQWDRNKILKQSQMRQSL